MLKISEKLDAAKSHDCTLTLAFDMRQKSRFKTTLDNGLEAALVLPRGSVLRSGDCLQSEDGKVVLIKAANELVSNISTDDAHLLARACYHLGNRHVPLHIGEGWLRYAHDHVLDEMLHGLGLHAEVIEAPFEPEAGAYGGHAAHAHHHGDDHHHPH